MSSKRSSRKSDFFLSSERCESNKDETEGSCSYQHGEIKGKVQSSPEKSASVSSLFDSQRSDERKKSDFLNDLFEDIKGAINAGSPMKPSKSPKILLPTFVLHTFNGFLIKN